MTTADDIIKRLDAWGAEPAKGAKRDAVLAGILKDANALVEAKETTLQRMIQTYSARLAAFEAPRQRPKVEWHFVLPFGLAIAAVIYSLV